MASTWTVQLHTVSVSPSVKASEHQRCVSSMQISTQFGIGAGLLKYSAQSNHRSFILKAIDGDGKAVIPDESHVSPEPKHHISSRIFQQAIGSYPPIVFVMNNCTRNKFAVWLCIATCLLVIAVRIYVERKSRYKRPAGSVADLVRRGQLRSDRRGISKPLKYDDPFNNPLVKVAKSNSTVEMCGKVYRLAPVTLTKEQQASHQKRRSRAYQWKRPTVFLKEGDSIPPDVDPDTVRWIPVNHPFATTASDIDEDLAQNNVYQKHGVPFRIQAEHEALQKKLEALQNEQKLDKLVIDPANIRDFERPFKSHMQSHEQVEKSSIGNQVTVDSAENNSEVGSSSNKAE